MKKTLIPSDNGGISVFSWQGSLRMPSLAASRIRYFFGSGRVKEEMSGMRVIRAIT